jgi:hypothetical protein
MTFKEYIAEESSPKAKKEWVLFLNLKIAYNKKLGFDTTYGGKYRIKKAKDLTHEEKKYIKKLKPYKGFTQYDKAFSDGEGEIVFFDSILNVNEIINYYKSFCKMEEAVPLKSSSKKHFGDIIDSL